MNAIGNREYYMNCADIRIIGNRGPGQIKGTPLKIANMPGYPVIQPPTNNGGPGGSKVTYYAVQ